MRFSLLLPWFNRPTTSNFSAKSKRVTSEFKPYTVGFQAYTTNIFPP